jgi:hypothetical protein
MTANRPRGLVQMRQELEARYANGEVPPAEIVEGGVKPLPVIEEPAPVTQPVTAPVTDDGEPEHEPTHEPARTEGGIDWEHKYRSVEGRINALQRKVAELEAENADLKRQAEEADQAAGDFAGHIADLEVEIQELKGSASTASQTARGKRISDAELEDYSPELVDLMRRAAQEENDALREEIARLRSDVDEVKPVVKQTKAEKEAQRKKDEEQAVYNGFLQNVMGYLRMTGEAFQRLNGDTAFNKWLLEDDKLTGHGRKAMLLEREKLLDAAGVARVFQDFLDEVASQSAAPATPTPTPAPPAQGKVSLEKLAGPGGTKVASAAPRAEVSDATRQIPESEIRAFTNGGFTGTRAERLARMKVYETASREGRVVQGR